MPVCVIPCSAAVDYTDGSGHHQVFVADEVDGTWNNAIEVPGTGTLNAGETAAVSSVSCSSAGNCSAGGYYSSGPKQEQAFIVSESSP